MKKIIKISGDHPFFILLLFVVLAYLPVFLPFFHLKNDLVTQNLPTRYFISESLYSGYFPWWNPFIHFGIPQYGDMNNGFWNPFMWLIAKIFGYNIRTITLEEMFYVLVGGWGMYKMTRELAISKGVSIMTALSYMSCGYITGHLQHFCWITGTAFFPYICLFLLRTNKNPIVKNFILGAIAFFLFVASTHPGLIIGAVYFFIFSLVFIFIFRKTFCSHLYHSKFWLINLIFFLLCGIFSTVVIVSNLDVLQHITRGSKVSLAQSLLHPTSFQSYLSLVFPLAVNKSSFFDSDISMRNVYMGLTSVAGIVFIFKYINKRILTAVSIPLLFYVLLSSGGVFKIFFSKAFPLIGYVRLNGEFAYFVIFIVLLSAAFACHALTLDKNFKLLLKKCVGYLSILFALAIIIALTFATWNHSSIFYESSVRGNMKETIKNIIEALGFNDLIIINATIQLLTLFFLIRKYSNANALIVLACNLILTTWLMLPFTGLGMASKKEMDEKMTVLPHGIYAPDLLPLNKTRFIDASLRNELWLLGSYSKKIGYPAEEKYPVQLKTSKLFFEDSLLHEFINKQAFVFLSTDTTIMAGTNFDPGVISIIDFSPGHLEVSVNNDGYHFITFLQNDYPFWETYINGKKEMHTTGYKTFIQMPLEKGKQLVEFNFNPAPIRLAMMVNMAIMIAGLLLLWMPRARNRYLFTR